MKRIILFTLLFFAASTATLSAQSLTFELPFYKGKNVLITGLRGIKTDTIAQGVIDEKTGTCQLQLKTLPGIYTLHIAPDKNFQFLWSGKEKIGISCQEEYIHYGNAVLNNSPENDSLNTWLRRGTLLQERQKLNITGTQLYDSLSTQYHFFQQELQNIQSQVSDADRQIAQSPLCAATYIKTRNFLERTSPALSQYAQDKAACEAFRNYYLDSLDMEMLYTTGMWFEVINTSLELYRNAGEYQREGVFKGHFAGDIIHILGRIQSQEVYEALVHDVVVMCEQFDWKQDASDVIKFVVKDGRITHPQGVVKIAMGLFRLQPGNSAPKIAEVKSFGRSSKATLLMFYESGCNNCDNELAALRGNYGIFKEKGVRVISISADNSKEVFEYHSKNFLWPDKLCDFKGTQGENFKNYGVIGTPTLFLIDGKGKIVGRYARISEVLAQIE